MLSFAAGVEPTQILEPRSKRELALQVYGPRFEKENFRCSFMVWGFEFRV